MIRFLTEATALCTARTLFSDEYVARMVFEQEYDPEFVSRHSNQLAGLWQSYIENNQ